LHSKLSKCRSQHLILDQAIVEDRLVTNSVLDMQILTILLKDVLARKQTAPKLSESDSRVNVGHEVKEASKRHFRSYRVVFVRLSRLGYLTLNVNSHR